jgi:hypothetical protein
MPLNLSPEQPTMLPVGDIDGVPEHQLVGNHDHHAL